MRVLLLYITHGSGHHHASAAIQTALRQLAPATHIKQVDAVQYTNPVLARLLNQTYMGVLKTRPDVWDYLYDNPRLVPRARKLQAFAHRYNAKKFQTLMQRVRPDVVACTQAFPCGMVADYKATTGSRLPLVGVLTDYVPHAYWIFDQVDRYVVPSEEAKARLMTLGVDEPRIQLFGIPIHPRFAESNPATMEKKDTGQPPLILIMGGSAGFGPLREIVLALSELPRPCRLHVITGLNKRLYRWCVKRQARLGGALTVHAYVTNMWALMREAALLITKPGGLTTAEALAVGCPVILIRPIPGQEANNARFLLRHDVAVQAADAEDALRRADQLLRHPELLARMRVAALRYGHPTSAFDTARLLLELHDSCRPPTRPTALVNASP